MCKVTALCFNNGAQGVTARAISGRLGDDGEFLTAQASLNSKCKCTGDKDDDGLGDKCAAHKKDGAATRGGVPWCYVKKNCADATAEDASADGKSTIIHDIISGGVIGFRLFRATGLAFAIIL